MTVSTSEFVRLPAWLAAPGAAALFSMRTFGTHIDDLAVNFVGAMRPQLVTQLLALCTRTAHTDPVSAAQLVELPVGVRIIAMLILASLSDQSKYAWHYRCSDCQSPGEFDLPLEKILEVGAIYSREESYAVEVDGLAFVVRRPTASDQLRWLEHDAPSRADVLRSILVRPSFEQLREAQVDLTIASQAIETAMDDFDPIVSFHVRVVCPECAAVTVVFPDLTGAALERLARVQRTVMDEVHQVASCYHWTEPAILALPAWRRRSYLGRIDAQAR